MKKQEQVIDLLRAVNKIVIRERTREEESRKRGEEFNIFSILGVETKETTLHSAIIANLLKPKADHGLGDTPLRLFMQSICNDCFPLFNYEHAEVEIEKDIGEIDADYNEGGRIDIRITDGVHYIVIENKIYAGDQPGQLDRYHNHCKDKNHCLLYLTLDGHMPSEDSVRDLKYGTDFSVISYKKDILNWLNKCKIAAIDHPKVRETISQYIHTIKKLTNQTMTNEERIKLFGEMESHIQATEEIFNAKVDFKSYLIRKYLIDELKEWAKSQNLIVQEEKDFSKLQLYSKLIFRKSDWNKSIAIEVKTANKELVLGIAGAKDYRVDQFKELFKEEGWGDQLPFGYENIPVDFSNPSIFTQLKDGKITEIIKGRINDLFQELTSPEIENLMR